MDISAEMGAEFSSVRMMRTHIGSRGQEQGSQGPEILGAAMHNKIAPCDLYVSHKYT